MCLDICGVSAFLLLLILFRICAMFAFLITLLMWLKGLSAVCGYSYSAFVLYICVLFAVLLLLLLVFEYLCMMCVSSSFDVIRMSVD